MNTAVREAQEAADRRWRYRHKIAADFDRGLSIVGLARKYAKTMIQIESLLRGMLRK